MTGVDRKPQRPCSRATRRSDTVDCRGRTRNPSRSGRFASSVLNTMHCALPLSWSQPSSSRLHTGAERTDSRRAATGTASPRHDMFMVRPTGNAHGTT